MEGLLLGVFGTDAESKSALLASLGKKSEAEGTVIYHRTEPGRKISLLDDAQFPQRIQGYAMVASICDHALFLLPRTGMMAAPDGELAVLLESFSLPGTIEVFESGGSPDAALAALKGTTVGRYPVEVRNPASTVLDSGKFAPKADTPGGTLIYIDRAFTVKGVGTVALGFVLSGEVSVHDKLRLLPGREGLSADVKGIQINDEDFDDAGRGIRVGLSLRGVEPSDLEVTHWLDDGSFHTSRALSLSFTKSQFYRQPLAGRDLHLQLPGEMLPAAMGAGTHPDMLTARLQTEVPVWEGMRASIVDLNARNLRVAGGCTFRF